MKKIIELFSRLWPLKKRKVFKIGPGENFKIRTPVPINADNAEFIFNYGDQFGNEYETRVTFNLKERKILKQDFKIIKKVKDLPGDVPKLIIDEDSIIWPELRIKIYILKNKN